MARRSWWTSHSVVLVEMFVEADAGASLRHTDVGNTDSNGSVVSYPRAADNCSVGEITAALQKVDLGAPAQGLKAVQYLDAGAPQDGSASSKTQPSSASAIVQRSSPR